MSATVHANMLHGTIAKISMDQCAHTHGVQFNDLEAAEAKLAKVSQERDRLANALENLLTRHCRLVESGDCGFWDVEQEPEVIEARAALDGGAPAALSGQENYMPANFQSRVVGWWRQCLGGIEETLQSSQRVHRFVEEALELAQACDISREECLALVDYVYGRPTGEVGQEVGGVLTTLAVLCEGRGMDMTECGENELARCWRNMDKIRAKQAAKRDYASPLPGPSV